ncbi:MAG: cytochrome c [Nitrospirota bacterium]
MRIFVSLVIYTVVLAVLALSFPYWGVFDVAASVPHTAFARWYFGTLTDHSVERYSSGIKLPQEYFSASPIEGFRKYDKMCAPCHGAPGINKSDTAKGMMPEPPDLSKSVKDMKAEEVFWIVKNGIKMTAMPSFGKSRNDNDIWELAAFVKKLPEISPEVYSQFKEKYNPGK